jgi:hypothetical protein
MAFAVAGLLGCFFYFVPQNGAELEKETVAMSLAVAGALITIFGREQRSIEPPGASCSAAHCRSLARSSLLLPCRGPRH